jgi:hypothetical protein
MSAEAGDASRCRTCGGELIFDGRFWKHTDGEPRHVPSPESEALSPHDPRRNL